MNEIDHSMSSSFPDLKGGLRNSSPDPNNQFKRDTTKKLMKDQTDLNIGGLGKFKPNNVHGESEEEHKDKTKNFLRYRTNAKVNLSQLRTESIKLDLSKRVE